MIRPPSPVATRVGSSALQVSTFNSSAAYSTPAKGLHAAARKAGNGRSLTWDRSFSSAGILGLRSPSG